jgi:hypothetical protein
VTEEDLADSLRIARRELRLALERRDDETADMLERAIMDLERRRGQPPQRVLRLPELPRQRALLDVETESGDGPLVE